MALKNGERYLGEQTTKTKNALRRGVYLVAALTTALSTISLVRDIRHALVSEHLSATTEAVDWTREWTRVYDKALAAKYGLVDHNTVHYWPEGAYKQWAETVGCLESKRSDNIHQCLDTLSLKYAFASGTIEGYATYDLPRLELRPTFSN